MAALPPIRRLYIDDYPTQKEWIGPFLLILNTFMQSLVSSLNDNLTLIENTTSDIKTIALITPPSVAAPAKVAWTKTRKPIAVVVGNVSLKSSTGASYTLGDAVQVQWQMSPLNDSLQITQVSGIVPSGTEQYTLTLVCIAG